jgi:lipopolysaccharide O-acetyltransferase
MLKIVSKVLDKYGVFGVIRLSRDYCFTKFFYRNCRLIRFPVYIRGLRYCKFGSGLTTGVGLRIDVFKYFDEQPHFEIGNNCQINDYVHIGAISSIIIGDGVLIASKVFITDHNHGDFNDDPEMDLEPALRKLTSNPVTIENNVWLGEGVMVMPGVTIGCNSIVGAGSIVTKSIPKYSMAVGTPAKVIKRYDSTINKWVLI